MNILKKVSIMETKDAFREGLQTLGKVEADMEERILDTLVKDRVSGQLDKILLRNIEYLQVEEKIAHIARQITDMGFSKNQRLLIDGLVSAYNEKEAVGEELYYRHGILDCVELLKEIRIL